MTTHRRSRIRRQVLRVSALVISSLVIARPLAAQSSISCSGEPCLAGALEQTLLVVPVLSQLTTSASTFSLVPTGGLTAAHFNTGNFQADAALTLTVRTNANSNSSPNKVILRWRATSASFTAGCGISRTSDLRYGLTSGTRTSSVPASETLLLDDINSSVSPATITLFFRVNNLQWTDAPAATCELPLAFSIAP